ncbi:MAG: hypothetical protein AB7Q45_10385 [Planctomycetaceae bacterium]
MLLSWYTISSVTAAEPFAIHVIDESTGRGVPLVELKTTPDETYLTDSNGYVALDVPTLLGQQVYFHVSSHGYEHTKDFFGYRGTTLSVTPGGEATIKIKRLNVAERLYRITGAGIYRDSVKLGKEVPIGHPLLNAQVCGQDTVQAIVRGDRIHWFWGDTDRLSHPLGQFNTSGAVSRLPGAGGLDPAQGINLEYFVDDSGFSRPMFQRENGVLIWVHGAFRVDDPQGKPRILTHFSRRKGLAEQLSHGLAVLNDETNQFEPLVQYAADEKLYPRGQSFRVTDSGTEYIYFAEPYAMVRVPATWEAVIDSAQYEAFTPFKAEANRASADDLDRDEKGAIRYAWKRNTAPVDRRRLRRGLGAGALLESDNRWRTIDVATGEPIQLHAGSIHWNEHRRRWIMIAHQTFGKPSFLGEVWYAEALQPEGPFPNAVRIVTHDNYSFYNVAHHEFFDQDAGRLIYFEGTYTKAFSAATTATPWYDYNQIMYRLDLADPRLAAAFVE